MAESRRPGASWGFSAGGFREAQGAGRPDSRPRLKPDLGAMSSSAGRRDLQRGMVSLATFLETSPALWSVDRATGEIEISGACHDRVQAALEDGNYPFRLSGCEQ